MANDRNWLRRPPKQRRSAVYEAEGSYGAIHGLDDVDGADSDQRAPDPQTRGHPGAQAGPLAWITDLCAPAWRLDGSRLARPDVTDEVE
jgi:hypothetical protein